MSRRISERWRNQVLAVTACFTIAFPIMTEAQTGAKASLSQSIMLQPSPAFHVASQPAELRIPQATIMATEHERKTSRIVKGALIGAVAGSAVLGGIEAHHAAHCDDCFFQGPAVALAFAVGAIGGGLLGWLFAAASQ